MSEPMQAIARRPWLGDLPRVLSRADAIARGFTPDAIQHRLDRRSWTRVLPHTYLTSDVMTWDDRLRAALAYSGEGAALSAAAALADTGLRSVSRRPSTVLVLVPRKSTARDRGWVRVRRTDRVPELEPASGPARAATARAVADLSLELARLDDVRALVAEVVRRGRCTVDELAREYAAGPRRHSAHLRIAIDEVTGGAWSAPEARAARLMRSAGIVDFEQNARIDLPDGRRFYADFLWRDRLAILEIDSIEHHFAPADLDATMARHMTLETLGYSVIHRSPLSIMRNPQGFVRGVRDWLDSRANLA